MHNPAQAYDQKFNDLEENLSDIKRFTSGYAELRKLYDDVPKKVEHHVMVPFLGSSQILAKGVITSTNATYVQLGSDLYVHRLISKAAKSVDQRIILAKEMEQDCLRSMTELKSRRELLEKLDEDQPNGPVPTDTDTNLISESDQGQAEESNKPAGSIRKTAEGFLEIIERIPDDEKEGDEKKGGTTLIEEIDRDEIERKRSASNKPRKSLFSQEFSKR